MKPPNRSKAEDAGALHAGRRLRGREFCALAHIAPSPPWGEGWDEGPRAARGFTLIEMLVVVALMGILAAAAQPLVELSLRRASEAELRHSLRQIRGAIDAYKQAADAGRIARGTDRGTEESGYPPALEALVAGVPDASSNNASTNASATATAGAAGANSGASSEAKLRIYFLRSLPRDPFADPSLPAAQTWALRSYESPPDAPQPGRDVFDVHSMAEGNGIDGTPYRSW